MNLTPEIVLQKIKEISGRHLVPDPSIGVDSLALVLGTTIEELKPHLDTLIAFGDIHFMRHDKVTRNVAIMAGSVKLIV